jgi:hypothetical protein
MTGRTPSGAAVATGEPIVHPVCAPQGLRTGLAGVASLCPELEEPLADRAARLGINRGARQRVLRGLTRLVGSARLRRLARLGGYGFVGSEPDPKGDQERRRNCR